MTTKQPPDAASIRQAREDADVKQGRLAAELKMSRTWYNEFEMGYHGIGKGLSLTDVLDAIKRIQTRAEAS